MPDQILMKREQAGANIELAKSIVDEADRKKRDLTKQEQEKIDTLLEGAKTLRADANRLEKIEYLESGITPGPAPVISTPHSRKPEGFASHEAAYRAGQWVRGTLLGVESAARYCRDHNIMAAGSEGVGTKGGFLTPQELSDAIINLQESYGTFRQFSRVIRTESDSISIPRRDSGLTTYYVSENTEVTASDVGWNEVTLSPRKIAALHKMSSELAEDSIVDLVAWMAQDIAMAFAAAEDDAGFNGDGTDNYGGIYGVRPKIIDGNHAAGAVDGAAGIDTFAEVTATDLTNVMAALPAYALPGARWYVSQAGYASCFLRLMAAAGGNTIDTLAGNERSYLGFPITVNQKMPTSTGDLSNVAMILFGDLSMASTMAVRRDFRFMVSSERYFELDQIGILATSRYDIKVHDLGDGTTAGPIVALVGE